MKQVKPGGADLNIVISGGITRIISFFFNLLFHDEENFVSREQMAFYS